MTVTAYNYSCPKLDKLYAERHELNDKLERVERAIKAAEKRLIQKVEVKETKNYWDLTYNGRTVRVKGDVYGRLSVYENGKRLRGTYYYNQSVKSLSLALAAGRY